LAKAGWGKCFERRTRSLQPVDFALDVFEPCLGPLEQKADRVCASRRDATRFLLGSGVDVVCHPPGRRQRRLEAPFMLPVLVDDR
jgi:hypothetical protein